MQIGTLIVLVAAGCALYTDIKWGKIPNVLILPVAVAGLAAQALQGPLAVAAAVGIALCALAIGLIAFSTKIMGGGDVKFFVAAAAALGSPDAVRYILFSLLCGGLSAVVFALARGRLGSLIANVRASALTMTAPVTSVKMPYAVALFSGALCLIASETIFPALRIPL